MVIANSGEKCKILREYIPLRLVFKDFWKSQNYWRKKIRTEEIRKKRMQKTIKHQLKYWSMDQKPWFWFDQYFYQCINWKTKWPNKNFRPLNLWNSIRKTLSIIAINTKINKIYHKVKQPIENKDQQQASSGCTVLLLLE